MFKKIKSKITSKMQDKIQNVVQEHDNWLVDKICFRIKKLACDINNNYDLEYILNDIKNGGYLENDKKECS